ncbi:hypothetical protein MKX08_009308 [Trichoderma sp. CBMAI-0020]|nr:hypothetical protein MKX08_009308 [Trichoderma sp. CBMAI-0020]
MSFFNQLGQGLAIVQQEAAKHINPENINRAAEEIRKHHATPENINRVGEEVQKALNDAVRVVGEAAEKARPHIEEVLINVKDTANHVEDWVKDEDNFEAIKNGAKAAAQGTANFAKENPGLIVGALMMFSPGIVTAPFMGIAGVLGFTPAGIAAKSIASGAQSAVGNVVAKSAFATVQSAATGGYGSTVLAGIVRVAGGAVAGADGIGRGLINRFGGGRQDPPPCRDEN